MPSSRIHPSGSVSKTRVRSRRWRIVACRWKPAILAVATAARMGGSFTASAGSTDIAHVGAAHQGDVLAVLVGVSVEAVGDTGPHRVRDRDTGLTGRPPSPPAGPGRPVRSGRAGDIRRVGGYGRPGVGVVVTAVDGRLPKRGGERPDQCVPCLR